MMLELRARQVGPWGMNSYGLVCPSTDQSILIDPGAEPETLTTMLAGTHPLAIMITHSHADHIGALAEMRERLNVPVLGHPAAGIGSGEVGIDEPLAHLECVPLGDHMLKVYHAPGHTVDQICIALEGDHRVLVGDTIFEGGPGKTWSANGFQVTLHTLRHVVLAWPDAAMCYPGHGTSFRLGDRRAEIAAFLCKDHADFFGDATWGM
jgi:hydroxyacylglutathione hydrolase